MWIVLGQLAASYCVVASWLMAAGDGVGSAELVEKAEGCLQQRSRLVPPEEDVWRDVVRLK